MEPINDFEKLILGYVEHKSLLDDVKKQCDIENAEIKSIMSKHNIPEYILGDTTIKYYVQKRESMNEEMLLEIAHNYGIPEIVKTKEYIDFDALEDAIYHERIPNDILMEMNKAKETKEVPTLRVVTKRGKKDAG